MNKIIFISASILILFTFACKKDSVIPDSKKCNCIKDTCRITWDDLIDNNLPADSCTNIIITDDPFGFGNETSF
jgi:hypothetical protein